MPQRLVASTRSHASQATTALGATTRAIDSVEGLTTLRRMKGFVASAVGVLVVLVVLTVGAG